MRLLLRTPLSYKISPHSLKGAGLTAIKMWRSICRHHVDTTLCYSQTKTFVLKSVLKRLRILKRDFLEVRGKRSEKEDWMQVTHSVKRKLFKWYVVPHKTLKWALGLGGTLHPIWYRTKLEVRTVCSTAKPRAATVRQTHLLTSTYKHQQHTCMTHFVQRIKCTAFWKSNL